MAVTDSPATDDATLSTAPGRDLAQAALGYAEMEALEQFAEAAPADTCRPLARHPDLDRADTLVRAFRARAGRPGPGS